MLGDSCLNRGCRHAQTGGEITNKDDVMETTNGMNAGLNAGYAEAASPQHSEVKTFTQAQINEIAAAAKREGFERAQRMQAEQPEYYAKKAAPMYNAEDSEAARIAKNDEVRRLVSEQMKLERQKFSQEYEAQSNQNKVQNLVKEFNSKKAIGAQKYADYNDLVNDESMADFPYLVKSVIENIDNAEDVLYELAKDPERLWHAELAAREPTKAGVNILKKISAEVKKRSEVVEEDFKPAVNNFVKKLASSPNVTSTNKNVASVDDFKKMFRM